MSKQATVPQPTPSRVSLRFEPRRAPGVGSLLVLHPDLDAWAMRAANASGFGGDAMPAGAARAGLPSVTPAVPAPAPRGSRPLRRLRALLRLFGRRARQRAELRELESLDSATLRDLGLQRCETGSVWSERIGLALPTRRRIAEHERLRLRSGLPLNPHALF